MWHNLASPPQNFRFYKFTENSGEQLPPTKDVNFDENRTSLFQPRRRVDNMSSVPEESMLNTCWEAVSDGTNQLPSSLRSTTKVNSTHMENRTFDIKLKTRGSHGRQEPKSMLQNKQKSSVNLSQKNHSSSVIREEGSKMTDSSKNNKSHNKGRQCQEFLLRNSNNQEENETFSQIMAQEINKTEFSGQSKQFQGCEGNFFYQMVATLREIKDISKESLLTKKKIVRMLQDKSQISFLYQKEEKSDVRHSKVKKQERKSFKRTQEKSTVKKLCKSIHLEERIGRVEQKLRTLSKKIQEETLLRKTATLSRTKKKSMSTLR